MRLITMLFILNATLLLLHEIESSYEKEWEILKLPGRITGFLLLHIPIIMLLFYGVLEIEKNTQIGLILGIACGFGGVVPFFVHKILVNRRGMFNSLISNILIYMNIITGIVTFILSVRFFVK